MRFISRLFLSMEAMLVMLIIFAVSIAAATFIENDFGTETVKAVIYNAKWFEILLVVLAANLIVNIIRHKLWRRSKLLSFLFHLAFLIILLGAGVTRYVGYEGLMHIRENGTSNTILSERIYLQVAAKYAGKEYSFEKPLLLSAISNNHFVEKIAVGEQTIAVRYKDYLVNADQGLVADDGGVPVLSMMVSDHGQKQDVIMQSTDVLQTASGPIAFDYSDQSPVLIHIKMRDDNLYITPAVDLTEMAMSDRSTATLKANLEHEFLPMTLYSAGELSFVLRDFMPKGVIKAVPNQTNHGGREMNNNSLNALIVEVSNGDQSREVSLFGGRGMQGEGRTLRLGDIEMDLRYGPKEVPLAFALKLVDFQLERYPGSNSPSSYASEVVLLDKSRNLEEPYRIYMNHILNYRGFRFFQSSYDQDEKGTVLSVSYDPGTRITYVGYLLLALGLFINFLNPKSRFRTLGKLIAKVQQERLAAVSTGMFLAFALVMSPRPGAAITPEETVAVVKAFDYDHARRFGRLLVQDQQGRIKPIDTMAHEVLNKVARADEFLGLHPDQVAIGMFIVPDYWQRIPMIRVRSKEIKELLGIDPQQGYAAFLDFFDPHTHQYKLSMQVEQATRKRPSMQNEFDKELIKVDEKLNICYMVYVGELYRIIPKQDDPNHTWYSYTSAAHEFPAQETAAIGNIMNGYIRSVNQAIRDGNWSNADKALIDIENYQQTHGAKILISPAKRNAEMLFNDIKVFQRLMPVYALTGFILLLLSFAKILRPKLDLALPTKLAMVVLVASFVFHTAGLALRWYVSGHAPWSNGYESMIYIAWATLLAGIIFSRQSPMALAATGILSGLILFVAHLSWMDPQITNLVPVLKSYWLTIHVSMITASYGFLGLGALLALITLVLFIVKREKNVPSVVSSIKELSLINEMTLTIGLVLITVGNFLGAVWANESWGRYWGWDPKETWALVTILVYSVVVHLRLIPKLQSLYIFNVAALLAFSPVIMTYFGVNYYLSGLHSYAKGDPVPIPTFVYYTVATIGAVIALSYRNRDLKSKGD